MKVSVTATNKDDPYQRFLGIFVDQIPAMGSSWWKSGSGSVQKVVSGQTVNAEFDVPKGKHMVYVGISQPELADLGNWAGTMTIDGQSYAFSKVDFDTFAQQEVNVGGSSEPSTGQSGGSSGVVGGVKNTFSKIKGKLTEGNNGKYLGIALLVIIVVSFGAWFVKKMKVKSRVAKYL